MPTRLPRRRAPAGAGFWIVMGVLVALLLLALAASFLTAGRPKAAEIGDRSDRGAWFKGLKQPDTGLSCCDISDCRPAKSEWTGGGWQVEIAGRMWPVPPKKVLPQASIFEDAVVCHSPAGLDGPPRSSPPTIYCFVPPPMGF